VEAGNPNIPAHMDGSLNCPRKWLQITVENVDQFIFGGFVNEILDNIKRFPIHGDYDMNRVILWDNFRAYKNPYVTTVIED